MKGAQTMKWTKVRAGVYRSGNYELRQAYWRASPDGWMICTDDNSFHDSTRLFKAAKRRAEEHAAKVAREAAAARAKCVDSPTGIHEFSHDEEYAQKHHVDASTLPRSCEYCGEEEPA